MPWLRFFVATLFLLSVRGPSTATAALGSVGLQVIQFTPQGTVKGVGQVTARFSEPVVAFGDPRVSVEPFTIDCPESGSSRWADSRNWVYDFPRDLPAGLRCTFRLRADVKALSGQAAAGPQEFAFSTGGPAILSQLPYGPVEEDQAFVLFLDAEPTEASVLEHVSFSVEGLPERIGVHVLRGEARAAIIKTLYAEQRTGPLIALQARQRFPNAAKVTLVWGAGVTSHSGVPSEQDQRLTFEVREAFTADFFCERENKRAECIPFRPLRLRFSAPVALETAKNILLTDLQGKSWAQAPVSEDEGFVHNVSFPGPFPEETSFQLQLPPGLADEAGRTLVNARSFPLTVKTGAFPPLAKFAARFGIVEWKADPVLPVTVRNLEEEVQTRSLRVDSQQEPPSGMTEQLQEYWRRLQARMWRIPPERPEDVLPWLRKVATAKRETSLFSTQENERTPQAVTLPRPHGVQSFEVVGIPFSAPGLYVVELESAKLGAVLLDKPQAMYVPAAALVTNLSVHLKHGRESSLVWVTSLDSGQPVPGAWVTVQNCQGVALWKGQTDQNGIARFGGLPLDEALPRCPWADEAFNDFYDFSQIDALDDLESGVFVIAQTADDLSFVHSSWENGIEPWRFQLPSEEYGTPFVAHTVLDRPLFRAGETVHMKHLLRERTPHGFALATHSEQPTTLSIRHDSSNERYEFPLQWQADGSVETVWEIPKEAKLGQYRIVFVRPSGKEAELVGPLFSEDASRTLPPLPEREWTAGSFRVEEFRVPLMKAALQGPATAPVAATEMAVDLSVQYLAGGGAGRLPVVLRSQVRSKTFLPPDGFDEFVFVNGAVQESRTRRSETEGEDEGSATYGKSAAQQRVVLELDAAGTARATVRDLPRAPAAQEVLAELEFRDPNGQVQTVTQTIPLWPAQWLVGIKPEEWTRTRETLAVRAAVVDVSGKPVAAALVRVEVFEQKTYSHRKRLVGGFYAYENIEERKRLAEFCQGKTGSDGILRCEGKPPASGNLILLATVTDDAGNSSAAHGEVWVEDTSGKDDWWFAGQDSDRIDVLPERRRYEPGDTARLQVRMPFRQATALVAVERDGGILDTLVVPLSGTAPVIELPIKAQYAPNAFVSVLAVRGRVGEVQATALVDLGKPAFKLGIAELRVGWQAHELQVMVQPEREVYRVREKAVTKIAVRSADGSALPLGSEVAIAAVDEGLLELLPNPTWNVLEAMMGRRSYGIQTATAQMQVVGKRHYGLKAVPHGGGGGRHATRELFDTLLLWCGRVVLDERGEATVEIPLNDSLTSFRIVAVANAGVSRFGSGAASIRVTQDVMVLPGLAPIVREGDRFRAEVTVRNTTDHAMTVTMKGQVSAPLGTLASQLLQLASGEARVAGWELTAPQGVENLQYEFEVEAEDGTRDRVQAKQDVFAAVPVRTLQATLSQWEAEWRATVELPSGAQPDRGGVYVLLSPTLAGGLDSVREWMRRYPYTCLEQRVSRAVALRDERLWQEVAAALPSYLDVDGLLKYFPTMEYGSDTLTSYVLAIGEEAGWMLPAGIQEQLITGLQRFVAGAAARATAVRAADLSLRKIAALAALARYGKAESQMLGTIMIEPQLWPTSTVLDWWSLLLRLPVTPEREVRAREAEQILRARLNFQGTTMGFSTERDDQLWWLMESTDVNTVRLLLHLLRYDLWKEDLGRIARGMLARQQRGAWDLTVANAWGVLAVEKFVQAVESQPVAGVTTARLAGTEQALDWAREPAGGTLLFSWPGQATELSVEHRGTGRPWVTIQSRAAIPLTAPLSSGYQIAKTLTPVEARTPGQWSRGDIIKVRLEIEAQSDMTWVVVNDPIPSGAAHLGSGLARDSQLAVQGTVSAEMLRPAFEERAFSAFRAYYEFVPKGKLVTEYTFRLNQSGAFHLPPTRVEALYAPEAFGELPNTVIEVQP
ncbi:MAG: alpha-2-macroglobulin [Deltaproteobacteria bacterium]|nr:alpha-2-macroglobulin [Deltaproteobacteria bacterium]